MKNILMSCINAHNSLGYSINHSIAILASSLVFSHVYGLNPDSLNMKLRPQIGLLMQYDDNYNLLDSSDPSYKGDGMFHLLPRFGFSRDHKANHFGIGFDSDFRKGMYAAPFKANYQAGGQVQLNYNSGLKISLGDYFMNTDFDLGLTDLPSITQRQMNNFKSNISYDITDKFTIYGMYDNRWNTHLNWGNRYKILSNVYGGGLNYNFTDGLSLAVDYKKTQDNYNYSGDTLRSRSLDNFDAKLNFPLTKSLESYISYTFKNQNSPNINYRNYASNRTVGGFMWKGRNRLKIWAKAGYESIVYESALINDFNNIVGMAGINLKVTEVLKTDFSAGIDGYSNFVFYGDLIYHFSNKTSFSISAHRKTESNFYTYSPSPYYIVNNKENKS